MKLELDTTHFAKAAKACSSAQCSVSFVEGENGALGFKVTSSMEDVHAFYSKVIGKVSLKLKDHLRSIGYTLSPEPIFSDEGVHFDIWKSAFHGRLADLCEGWTSVDAYLKRSLDLITENREAEVVSRHQINDVIAMLNAAQSFASQASSEGGGKNSFAAVKHAEAC